MHPDPINLDANLDVVDPGVVGLTKEFFLLWDDGSMAG